MGLCIRARISMLPVVDETIDGFVDDRYIEIYCMTKRARALKNPQPPAQQPFDERVAYTYTWDMLEANQGAFLFMHNSMHQLQLHIREPRVNHNLPSREEFQHHANWPEGRLFHQKGAADKDEESKEEVSGDEEYMSDED